MLAGKIKSRIGVTRRRGDARGGRRGALARQGPARLRSATAVIDLGVDLYDPRTYLAGLPLEAFARLRRECPVYWQEERAILDWPAGRGYWAITRYADVDLVNRNPQLFSSHLGATQIRDPKPEDLEFQQKMMLNLDPPGAFAAAPHRQPRPSRRGTSSRLEAGIRERARAAVDRVAPLGRCDFPAGSFRRSAALGARRCDGRARRRPPSALPLGQPGHRLPGPGVRAVRRAREADRPALAPRARRHVRLRARARR